MTTRSGFQHGHDARRLGVQVVANGVLQQRDINQAVASSHTDAIAEGAQRGRRHATPPHPGQGRHARIIPALDTPALTSARSACASTARCRSGQARKLDLLRPRAEVLLAGRRVGKLVDAPEVVKRAMRLEPSVQIEWVMPSNASLSGCA